MPSQMFGTFNTFFLIEDFLQFWFVQAPLGLIIFFQSFNNAFLKLFSFQLLTRTFFKPWKNEYREGLVGFSIIMGMILKSMVIVFDLFILMVLVLFETCFVVTFVLTPLIAIIIVFI